MNRTFIAKRFHECVRARRATILLSVPLLVMLAVRPATAQTLTPQEVFRRVAPSVVVIEVKDVPETGKPRLIASGSGVIIPDRPKDGIEGGILVATNCHVVDQSSTGLVGIQQGDDHGFGGIVNRDTERDLCLVYGFMFGDPDSGKEDDTFKKLPAVQVGSSQSLEVGDTVYAVGAPQGLELSLSNGLVSGFREHKGNEYIQTTAPISKGSSGGGLFDAQGRLVGITTMYVKDGQALNFAVPAELIASAPNIARKTSSRPSPQPRSVAARASADAAAEAPDTPASAPKVSQKAVQPNGPKQEPVQQARNDRWREIHHHKGHGVSTYIDTRSLKASAGSISAWVKRTSGYLSSWVVDGKDLPYHEEFQRITFFCNSWEMLISESYITNSRGIQLESRGKQGPFTVSPTSGYDPIITAVCSP